MNSPEIVKNIQPELTEEPSPQQLFMLAKAGKTLGKSQGRRWKPAKDNKFVHFFMPRVINAVTEMEDDVFRYSIHRITGRVAFLGAQHWSMRISESFSVRDIDANDEKKGGRQDSYRTNYKFEWTRQKTHLAQKQVCAVYVPLDIDAYDPEPTMLVREQSSHQQFQAGAATMLQELKYSSAVEAVSKIIVDDQLKAVMKETERVSSADCDRLTSDVHKFREQSRML